MGEGSGAVSLVGGATIERGLTPLNQSIPSARGGCPCLSVCDQTGSVQTTSTKQQHGRRCSHTAVLIAVLAVRHPCPARQHRFRRQRHKYAQSRRSEQSFLLASGSKTERLLQTPIHSSFRDTVQYSSSTKYPWTTTTSYSGGDVGANYVPVHGLWTDQHPSILPS